MFDSNEENDTTVARKVFVPLEKDFCLGLLKS